MRRRPAHWARLDFAQGPRQLLGQLLRRRRTALTDNVNVGTNGGSAYTRPSTSVAVATRCWSRATATTPPAGSKRHRSARALSSKTYYDDLGRTTKSIENYVDGTPSDSDDKTTEYTYDGNGHMLTLKADLTGGAPDDAMGLWHLDRRRRRITSNDILKETD